MKKIIIITILLAIFFAGCLQLEQAANQEVKQTLNPIEFQSLITGCAVQKEFQESNSTREVYPMPPEMQSLIELKEGILNYTREVPHACGHLVELKHEIEKDTINIIEVWDRSETYRCVCGSTVSATIKNIPKGEYLVVVYDGVTGKQSIITSQNIIVD